MRARRRRTLAAPPPDPFGEYGRATYTESLGLLGARFEFQSDSARLMRLVHLAYARLPSYTFGRAAPRCRVRLALTATPQPRPGEPPLVRPLAGGGLLAGVVGGSSFVAVNTHRRSALVVLSQDLLRYPYHARYELLEFAVYVLAARVQGLVPLHAACVGRASRGVLLVGASGAGKSTLMLHSLLAGLDFLAEDSVLVQPESLRATGVPSFLHLRPDSLHFLSRKERAAVSRSAAMIRRRSGVSKLEIDLRQPPYRLAHSPQQLRAVVYLSAQKAGRELLLGPLPRAQALRRLATTQRYAARQPGWGVFCRQLAPLPAYELRRGGHPREGVEALRALLDAARH